ncbi:MAG: hypothetical protein RQ801_05435 [Spirochaetaceae bacterium]|nr:hypothetical protein [Spirochaetaceae bacterium]MDT8297724.1 hypothetical protein [Spirochaetaceae bacterium]
MKSPRMWLGGLILFVLAPGLPALNILISAEVQDGTIIADGIVNDLEVRDLVSRLDEGGTARLTWLFRMAGSDDSVVRFARRDALGEGYVVFEEGQGTTVGPLSANDLIQELSMLHARELSVFGPWREGARLEGRLFLDYDLGVPPVTLRSLSGESRDSSPWTPVDIESGKER